MKTRKMSAGVKTVLIFGLILILVGCGWFGYTVWQNRSTPSEPVDDIPAATRPTTPVSTVKKVYKDFYMPNDKDKSLYDDYLDIVLVEAGRLYDNDALKTALAAAGVQHDGYYFLAEMTFDSAEKFKGVIPFGYLNGHKDGKTEVAVAQFYIMNSDLTDVKVLGSGMITPGCHYVLVGYANYDVMDNAQMHVYNSDYDVSIVHMQPDSETIAPYGYTKVQVTEPSGTDVTEPTAPSTPSETVSTESTSATENGA